MKEFFDNLRYDSPILFRSVVGLFSVAIFLWLFMSIPSLPLMRAIGVEAGQTKLAAAYYAAFWHARAATNQEAEAQATHSLYGSMVGIDKNGMLIISTPVGAKFLQSVVHIADVKVTDLYGTAEMIGELRGVDAKFDVYPNDQVVVWVRGAPFNVKLIEAGHAAPDPSPPTNIVDKAFATYYWRILKGAEPDQHER